MSAMMLVDNVIKSGYVGLHTSSLLHDPLTS